MANSALHEILFAGEVLSNAQLGGAEMQAETYSI
jgi:hypothetical protein